METIITIVAITPQSSVFIFQKIVSENPTGSEKFKLSLSGGLA
jgi:hypothetical protein